MIDAVSGGHKAQADSETGFAEEVVNSEPVNEFQPAFGRPQMRVI